MRRRAWARLGAGLALAVGVGALGPALPPPLRDADGRPLPPRPEAVPRDPNAHTRAGLYATGAQAMALEAALGAAVLHIEVTGPPEAALAAVRRTLARRGLPPSAPILLAGRDLVQAARAADALQAAGHPAVWLVTR